MQPVHMDLRHHHPIGVAHTQRVQQDRFQNAEDGRVSAHSESHSQHRRPGEQGMPQHQPQSEAHVLGDRVDAREGPLVAAQVGRGSAVAELPRGGSGGFGARHPLAYQFLFDHLAMQPDLVA